MKSYVNLWVEVSQVSHHLVMFCSFWFSASGDKKYLICQVTSQNQLIKRSANLMSRSSPWYVMTLSRLLVIGIVVVQICSFLFVT